MKRIQSKLHGIWTYYLIKFLCLALMRKDIFLMTVLVVYLIFHKGLKS